MKNGGKKNIKTEISLFLGFGERENNNKHMELEIDDVAAFVAPGKAR